MCLKKWVIILKLIGDDIMFDRVWKEQIVKPAGKVGIFKPKQGFELEEENEGDCCENAKKDLIKVLDLPEWDINSTKCDFLYEWLELLIERLIKLPFTTKYGPEYLEVLENIKEEWDRCEKNV